MWSDSSAPGERDRRTAGVAELLPAPRRRWRIERPLRIALDAEQLAARLRTARGFAWLDGGTRGNHVLAFDPLLRLRAADGTATLRGNGSRRWRCGAFDALEAVFGAGAPAAPGARMIGYLGYELAAELETLPKFPPADLPIPDMSLGLHDLWIEGRDGDWVLRGDTAWRSAADVGDVVRWLENRAAAPAPPTREVHPEGRSRSHPAPAAYRHAVARTVRRIVAGDLFETNLCRRLEVALPTEQAWDLYRRMRRTGDARYAAFLRAGRGYVLSRSPECFLSVRDGTARSVPIKGTRPRHGDPVLDDRMREELLAADKDRAELAMIVDLVRNDLGRVCRPGTVRVRAHASLMQLATVWHTYSEVEGRLSHGVGPIELLRATFPPGSITGAPKIQAVAVAAAEEPRRRGPAMGAFGWLALGGDMELSVAIRTAVACAGRVVYHAGCGIVADSDPAAELEETRAKARVFREALSP